jgi:DNA sulfur modification protein DndD
MKQFFDFVKTKLVDTTSVEYLFILWSLVKSIDGDKARKSDYIKDSLQQAESHSLTREYLLSELPTDNLQISTTISDITTHKLNSIQIKNFKSFGEVPDFPNDKGIKVSFTNIQGIPSKKVIFYSPNGGGKTSLCEAIEYKLTHEIKECKRRRSNLGEYIKRNESNHSIDITFLPELDTTSLTEVENEFFKNCFIEKNRIKNLHFLVQKTQMLMKKI